MTSKKESGIVFTTVFIIIWIGSMIITLNTKLLGGKMSLMQCICLLGYCLFPLDVAALLVRVFFKFLPGIFKLFIVAFTFMWSTKGTKNIINILIFFKIVNILASVPFIAENINPKKKLLAVYPVMLFFIYLNYFILV
jgi:protein YIPF6